MNFTRKQQVPALKSKRPNCERYNCQRAAKLIQYSKSIKKLNQNFIVWWHAPPHARYRSFFPFECVNDVFSCVISSLFRNRIYYLSPVICALRKKPAYTLFHFRRTQYCPYANEGNCNIHIGTLMSIKLWEHHGKTTKTYSDYTHVRSVRSNCSVYA